MLIFHFKKRLELHVFPAITMSTTAHRLYLLILVLIVVSALAALIYYGYTYYNTALHERFFHGQHQSWKPSGAIGHGLGIIGSLLIIIGVFSYMARKRWRSLSRIGYLKYWLEFHIFLCTLGPILVLFHTSFKFGGIVAISFWSMVAVFLSGIIGRFIYLQIPRTIEGRELSLNEVRNLKKDVGSLISESTQLDSDSYHLIVDVTQRKPDRSRRIFLSNYIRHYFEDRKTIRKVRQVLKDNKLPREQQRKVMKLVKHEISINRRIERLNTMQNLFKYWHVAHLPFALVMLVIMLIHVGVTIAFGYTWIF